MSGNPTLCPTCQAPLPPGPADTCAVCGARLRSSNFGSSGGNEYPIVFGAPLSRNERLAGVATEIGLFVVTLGVGWVVWFVMTARSGMTPAGKIRDEVFVTRRGEIAPMRMLLIRQSVLFVAWVGVAAFATGLGATWSGWGADWLVVWALPIVFVSVVFADLLSVWLPGHTRYLDRILGLRLGQGAGHTFSVIN